MEQETRTRVLDYLSQIKEMAEEAIMLIESQEDDPTLRELPYDPDDYLPRHVISNRKHLGN